MTGMDSESMDEEDREEMEALLYSQIYHDQPASE